MALISRVTYRGELRTEALHLRSLQLVLTDAPLDNQGKGEAFSPTDLMSTSLACCAMTIMGIKARELGLDLTGTEIEVEKVMASEPRRVSEIHVTFHFSVDLSTNDRLRIERAGLTCPVAKSLHPDLKQHFVFHWPTSQS
jgi:uncharacterized OsmC-like protein